MKRLNLCLHAGGFRVEREQLTEPALPVMTASYTPVPHIAAVECLERNLSLGGYSVVGAQHALARDGQRYFGLFQIESPDTEKGLVVGLRNSYDKSFPVGVAAGSQVFVCDNLAFSGTVRLFRKHTVNVMRDMPLIMGRVMGKLMQFWTSHNARVESYKARGLDDKEAAHLAVSLYRMGGISKGLLPDVMDQWFDPAHEEFRPRNTWSFHNAVTEAIKGRLDLMEKRSEALHGLLDKVACFRPVIDVEVDA